MGRISFVCLMKELRSEESGKSKVQKGADFQTGTIRTPDSEDDLIFLIVGMILEMGGQSQTFSLSQECAKASIPIVFGHKKFEKNLVVFALEQSANGSKEKGPNKRLRL